MTVDAGGFTGGRGGDMGRVGMTWGGVDSGLRRNDGWVGGGGRAAGLAADGLG